MKIKMAYMTLNRNIPSRKADGVAVMNMCSQFAKLDFDVELNIPSGQAKSAELLLQGKKVPF